MEENNFKLFDRVLFLVIMGRTTLSYCEGETSLNLVVCVLNRLYNHCWKHQNNNTGNRRNQMDVFISWSGKRSKAFARALAKWLHTVHHYLKPWMSDKDLRKGDRWLSVIGNKLSQYYVGIICVTPENVDSPWLLFEAGALSKALGESRICPLLLGMQPSELNGPLSQFQATTFGKDEILKLVLSLNDELGKDKLETDIVRTSFGKFWPDLESEVAKVARIGISSSNLRSVVDALQHKGFPQPAIGRVVCFKEGFESHSLYDIALSEAHTRLYVFGRKNRKLFDKDHWASVTELHKRIAKGFDFRCLFLDPTAPEHVLSEEHEDEDFLDQLTSCVGNAVRVLRKSSQDPDSICRVYSNHRHHAIVVVDNVVMYAPIKRDTRGCAKRLTKMQFEVVDSGNPIGEELLKYFLSTWESAKLLTEVVARRDERK